MVKDRSDLLGAWAFKGQAEDVETIYEGMQKEFGDKVRLDYEQGCALDGNDESGFSAALKTAEASDVVVVCLGESKQWSERMLHALQLLCPIFRKSCFCI